MTTTKSAIIEFPDISQRMCCDDSLDYIGPFVDIICEYLDWNPKIHAFHGGGKLEDINSVTTFQKGDMGTSLHIERKSKFKFEVSRLPADFCIERFYRALPKLLEDRLKLTPDNPQDYLSEGI